MSDSRTRDETVALRADDASKPSATAVRAELERILASRYFQQAVRATHFLRFVTEQTLAGGGQRLKGYTIGVEVFGRPADFDAQADALVRVEAGRLRRRLVEYYASEGKNDAIRIDLPRGSYAIDYHFVNESVESARAPESPTEVLPPLGKRGAPWQRIALGLAAVLFGAIGVIAWQQAALREADRALEAVAEPARGDWPRIVVVPLENLGADAALDDVAASMTEEIMLRLDELDLFVIASQASWYGPSHAKDLESASAGGYLLTGSVRGNGKEARITLRLIEAGSGAQLWTAAYDEVLGSENRPTLQEQVARDVAAIAAPYGPIFEAELALARRSVNAPRLRDCLVTYQDYRRRSVPEVRDAALACFQSVADRQPELAPVWSGLAMLHVDDYALAFGRTGDRALHSARTATHKALALDRNDFRAHLALARIQYFDGDPAFRQTIERTLVLRPDNVQALAQGGFLLVLHGDAVHGLAMIEQARKIAKAPPGLYDLTYALAYLREQRFSEALTAALRIPAQNWVIAQAATAAAASHSGRHDIALEAAKKLQELYPQFEADALANFERWHFDPGFYDVLVSGLEEAGLELRERAAHLPGG